MRAAYSTSLLQLPAFLVAVLLPGCDGSTEPAEEQLHVAGTYSTAVSLTENTCTGISVSPLPTTVAHTPGSTVVSLTHGPLTHAGTITTAGAFTTAPRTVGDPGGPQSTLSITGLFTTGGFTADVAVAVTSSTAPACAYKVRWVGTKQGSPNTIP
jgi:hypothetical protein